MPAPRASVPAHRLAGAGLGRGRSYRAGSRAGQPTRLRDPQSLRVVTATSEAHSGWEPDPTAGRYE